MHCHLEHREQTENSIRIIQKFFEKQYDSQVQTLETECSRLYQERSCQLQDECHSELVRGEGHVGSQFHEASAKLAVAESRIALADRRASEVEVAAELAAKVAATRERAIKEHLEAASRAEAERLTLAVGLRQRAVWRRAIVAAGCPVVVRGPVVQLSAKQPFAERQQGRLCHDCTELRVAPWH